MKIIVEHHHYCHGAENDLMNNIFTFTKLIHQQNIQIMANFAEIKAAFDELKTAVTDERAQANAKLDELNTKIDDLTTNINEGGTTEERDALLADVKSLATEVKAIIPDPVENPIPEVPGEQPGGTGTDSGL
jgi:hypothetical protein